MQEMKFWSLDWEDALEKEMATRSSTLVWKIPWTEEPGGLQSKGSQRVEYDWAVELKVKSTGMDEKAKPKFMSLTVYESRT